jgi:hypothetical protein
VPDASLDARIRRLIAVAERGRRGQGYVAQIAVTETDMTPPTEPANDGSQPGVLGDETEEQNLGQPGDPSARITEEEVDAAFGGDDDAALENEEEADLEDDD